MDVRALNGQIWLAYRHAPGRCCNDRTRLALGSHHNFSNPHGVDGNNFAVCRETIQNSVLEIQSIHAETNRTDQRRLTTGRVYRVEMVGTQQIGMASVVEFDVEIAPYAGKPRPRQSSH